MSVDQEPVVVIGGGAAGMVAAWRAASLGARVVLIERNLKLGIKLLISGGGKCNITHAGDVEDIRSTFSPREGRFLRPALFRFSNTDILTLLNNRGIATSSRPDGKVFPASGRAKDVVDALTEYLRTANVDVRLGTHVKSIEATGGCVSGIVLAGEHLKSPAAVLATGGVSYPKTGTTGDGFAWARALGHSIVPLRAALAPIAVAPGFPVSWRGVALRGGCLSAFAENRKICEWQGDLLFSHEGISGPAALEVSGPAARALEGGAVSLRYDFFPSTSFPELDRNLNEIILNQRSKMIETILERWLPNRIVPRLLATLRIDPSTRGYRLTREQRRSITLLLKSWSLGQVLHIPIDRGEVTAGGIELREVDPQTMASRIVRGLFICGEVLDVAGPVGGYNLQAAFSTGYVAGESAAAMWLGSSTGSQLSWHRRESSPSGLC